MVYGLFNLYENSMKQILSLFYFADKETEEYKDVSVTQGPTAVRVLCSEAHPASA